VSFEHWHEIITAPGTRHWRCAIFLERSKDFIPADQAADRSRTDAGRTLTRRSAGEVMIERNSSKEVCERNPESHCCITKSIFRNETVSVVEGVEQRE
jgi:hypothetical protein